MRGSSSSMSRLLLIVLAIQCLDKTKGIERASKDCDQLEDWWKWEEQTEANSMTKKPMDSDDCQRVSTTIQPTNIGIPPQQPNETISNVNFELLREERSTVRLQAETIDELLMDFTVSSHHKQPRPDSYYRSLEHFERRLAQSSEHAPSQAHAPHFSSDQWAHRGRHLSDESLYEPLRIKFDTQALDDAVDGINFVAIQNLKDKILPDLKNIWSTSLSVIPEISNIMVPQGVCGDGVDIDPSYTSQGAQDTDLIIFVHAENCGTSGRLASANPCYLHAQTDRPIVGRISICLGSKILEPTDQGDSLTTEQATRATQIVSHEVAHILALISTLYPYYRDRSTPNLDPRTKRPIAKGPLQCVDGSIKADMNIASSNTLQKVTSAKGVIHYEIVTPSVRQVTRNQFGCQTLTGARLENQPTTKGECFGSHWDERLFYTELMGPLLSDEINIFSALTVALMEDSGWYKPNYNLAKNSIFGLGAGCAFVTGDCLIDGLVPSYSKGFFCNYVLKRGAQDTLQGTPTCDASHYFISECDLIDQADARNGGKDIPEVYQYFDNPKIGPYRLVEADYCPTASLRSEDCRNPRSSQFPGEIFGPTSKCFNMRAPSIFGNGDNFAACFPTYCNPEEQAVEITIGNKNVLCEYDGQVHPFPTGLASSASGDVIECPKFAVICPHLVCPQNCSGRGICNFGAPRPRCECFDPADFTPNCIDTPYAATRYFKFEEDTAASSVTDGIGTGLAQLGRPGRPVEGVVLDPNGPTIEELMNGSRGKSNAVRKRISVFVALVSACFFVIL